MKVWGIHMGEKVGSSPLENNYVAIGWHELGDLSRCAGSREQLKDALLATYPDIKKGAVAGNAGVLFRFVNSMQVNDIVVYPSKADRMVNIGRVSSGYRYEEHDPHEYPNQRSIEWLGSFPRSDFSQAALNEIGAFITLFSVKRHATEFLNPVNLSASLEPSRSHHLNNADDDADDTDTPDDDTATENIALQAVQTTEDFIIKQRHSKLDGYEFEYFVTHLLECMGYKARVPSKSGDSGVDVIASKIISNINSIALQYLS